MIYSYTYHITGDNGDYLVTFPDIPEALTGGETIQECHDLARDCLIGALAGYIQINKAIPLPDQSVGNAAKGATTKQGRIYLRPLEAAKVSLWNCMAERKMTRIALAESFDVSLKIVQRWIDLSHNSKIEDINRVLRLVFHKRLVTGLMDAV